MMTGLSPNANSRLHPDEKYPSLPADWSTVPDHEPLNELNQAVLRACEPDPKRRYQTAAEMRSDLELLASQKSLLRVRRLERAYHRSLLVLAGVGAAVVVGGVIAGFFFLRGRAAEQSRRRELREIQVARLQPRLAGWFTNDWSRLQRAAAIRTDQDLLEEASALLAGLDVRPVKVLEGNSAASAAFGPDGRALVGGVGAEVGDQRDLG